MKQRRGDFLFIAEIPHPPLRSGCDTGTQTREISIALTLELRALIIKKMNRVERQFADKALIRGGLLLFSKVDAAAFIEACRSSKVLILGIDGFYLTGQSVQPSMENSVDLSTREYLVTNNNVYSDAISFISERDDNLFF